MFITVCWKLWHVSSLLLVCPSYLIWSARTSTHKWRTALPRSMLTTSSRENNENELWCHYWLTKFCFCGFISHQHVITCMSSPVYSWLHLSMCYNLWAEMRYNRNKIYFWSSLEWRKCYMEMRENAVPLQGFWHLLIVYLPGKWDLTFETVATS